MRIEVTYLKTRFTETFNDKMSYEKLKSISQYDLKLEMALFKTKTIMDFHSDYKIERWIFRVFWPLTLLMIPSLITLIILDFPENGLLSDILMTLVVIGFLSFFPYMYSHSYALSLREIKKSLKLRNNRLIKSHKNAISSSTFEEYLAKQAKVK
ncbi:hypothetical protein [Roseivirga sp. UBA1976]|uniref:hypothetical protein n=1 Tax=Roseivirga sp. UBA1976 TaxID=1947386 RepID=UPI00257CDF97|nr:MULTISPECIES: hypothetical protein [Bacteroidota]|tara:strand:+ start:51195 stop:51656 length:462 start_codon:yes stop_codon:yes gene_type:complete